MYKKLVFAVSLPVRREPGPWPCTVYGRGIIFAVLPIQLCVRRKAAFNKSLIKGKQRRGRRLSSSSFLDHLSFPSFPPPFLLVSPVTPDRSSFFVSRASRLSSSRPFNFISFALCLFHARRDYVAGQNMGYREREEGGGKKEGERERGGKAKGKIRKKGSQLSRTGGSIENRFVLSFSSKSMRIEVFSF